MNILVPSYNQPKFGANATWNPNATTVANNSTIGTDPALFIDTNNTIYTVNHQNSQIHIWFNNSASFTITLYGKFLLLV